MTSVSRPTNFRPGDKSGEASYRVTVTNTGGAATDGTPIQVTDELPEGLSLDARGASGEDGLGHANVSPGAKLSCVFRSCTYTGVVPVDDTLVLTFPVDVAGNAGPLETNVVRVSGGGAPDAAMATPTAISEVPARFGVSPGGATTALSSSQAGAHPDLTTSIAFNTVNAFGALAGAPKDTVDALPPGFAGDLVDTPSCPAADFAVGECALATQIGVTTVTLVGIVAATELRPVYNLAPEPGQVARLGFTLGSTGLDIQGAVTVRPGDYGLSTSFLNVNQVGDELDNVSLTVWGVPADPSHDPLRSQLEASGRSSFGHPSDAARAPFLTNPTSCGSGPLQAGFTVDSWEEPASSVTAAMSFGPIVGCDRLGMEPSLTAETTTSHASSATGLDLNMSIPQTYNNAYGVATSTLKKAVVTLPEGMTVNPSAGAGLQACSEAQFEEEAVRFLPGQGCPSESKLGTVKILSPSLSQEASGSVFLAEPAPFAEAHRNPFGALLALYIVARIPDRGVLVKAAGEVQANPLTGQLTTTFDSTNVATPHAGLPPLPFSLFTFRFNQGATSPLVTPPACGNYTVQAQLTPLSNPEGTPLTPSIPPFPISSAFDGGSCPSGGVAPFAPQVLAGTQNNSAGSFSPMYLRVIRGDGEQEITGFASQLPAGLTANLSGVPFCSDAAIAAAQSPTRTGAQEQAEPSCPPASQIGHTLVGAGVGSVLAYAPGKVYLAGPFQGAPFSIAAITSAKVGPFDLGTVVVHLPLQINPETAAVTIPAGAADQIPHIIKGIVIHVRDIRVYIDKPNFTLNPTSCNPMSFAATVIGSGQSFTNPADDVPVTVTDPFQAADCANLQFKPSFQVATAGKASKANGAGLTVKLTFPPAPPGGQSNVRYVKVELPKQLPSRLTTIQKACLAAVFNANPAACPAASLVGHARAITPILPVPLEGPAYLVSHGGEEFPSLTMVLQGYGVRIDLVGSIFINKAGITSNTFKTVPDQPVTSFELTLPQGPYSALGANLGPSKYNFCGQKMVMPTHFIAQNGMEQSQNTPISVTGCPPSVSITKTLVKGNSVAVTVKVGETGTVKITGRGLRTTTKRGVKAGTHVITVPLTAAGRAAKRHHAKLKIQASLTVAGKTGTTTTTLRA